ncbi:hypothetical protein KKA14_12890, partial [bacterium]|nr:hypothetical protein [bacterium]
MRLNFPLKDKEKWLTATKHYEINESIPPNVDENSIGGWYPVGMNNFWHAGAHFDCGHSIHAVADGTMVAYRVSEKLIQPSELINQYEEPKGKTRKIIEHPISDNFVLTKHDYKPPEGDPFTFYVLYMHLLPLKELNDAQKKKLTFFHKNTVTTKVKLNIRDGALSTNTVILTAPVAAELIFENPIEIADEESKLITPTDNQYYKKIKGYKHNGTYQAVSGYVNVHSKYIQVKKAYTPLLKVVKTCDVELNKG